MAALAMEAAKEKKAEVAEIDATALDFKKPGCIGCSKCQQSEKFECSLDDGIAHAVATLPQYDTIVLATPIYWFSYSAQIKMFVDRMFSLIKFGESGDIRTPLAGKSLRAAGDRRGRHREQPGTFWNDSGKFRRI